MQTVSRRTSGLLALAAISFGAVSAANAIIVRYEATLTGAAEAPANNSPGIGSLTLDFDNVAHTFTINLTFSGLVGTTSAAHIHAATASPNTGTAGVATTTPFFAGFPIGVSSGSYQVVLDSLAATSYNGSYVTANGGVAGAESALVAAMDSGRAYFNLHTNVFGGGEIRGFIPSPGAAAVLGMGGVVAQRRRRR